MKFLKIFSLISILIIFNGCGFVDSVLGVNTKIVKEEVQQETQTKEPQEEIKVSEDEFRMMNDKDLENLMSRLQDDINKMDEIEKKRDKERLEDFLNQNKVSVLKANNEYKWYDDRYRDFTRNPKSKENLFFDKALFHEYIINWNNEYKIKAKGLYDGYEEDAAKIKQIQNELNKKYNRKNIYITRKEWVNKYKIEPKDSYYREAITKYITKDEYTLTYYQKIKEEDSNIMRDYRKNRDGIEKLNYFGYGDRNYMKTDAYYIKDWK